MGWQLTSNVRFCIASDRVIFLDVARDRYFALPAAAGNAFRHWLARPDASPVPGIVARLQAERLVVATDGRSDLSNPPIVAAANALGRAAHAKGLGTAVDVTRSLMRVHMSLRRTGLLGTLARLRPDLDSDQDAGDIVRQHAAVFVEARRRLPLAASCLPDSLAMLDYLRRRGLGASIVFGVTGTPFRAHCWVQLGDEILNDALDHVAPFTPILQR